MENECSPKDAIRSTTYPLNTNFTGFPSACHNPFYLSFPLCQQNCFWILVVIKNYGNCHIFGDNIFSIVQNYCLYLDDVINMFLNEFAGPENTHQHGLMFVKYAQLKRLRQQLTLKESSCNHFLEMVSGIGPERTHQCGSLLVNMSSQRWYVSSSHLKTVKMWSFFLEMMSGIGPERSH